MTWKNCYVLGLDAPLRGDAPLTASDHVEDMVAAMVAAGVERCRFIGYCSGAGFALVATTEDADGCWEFVGVNGESALPARPHRDRVSAQHRRLPRRRERSGETAASIFTTMVEVAAAGEGHESPLPQEMNFPCSHEQRLFRYARSNMAYRYFDAPAVACRVPRSTLVTAGRRVHHTDPETPR